MSTHLISLSDLRALSFVQVIRDLIEEQAQENLRALIEDDPKKWLLCLVDALGQASNIAQSHAAIQTTGKPSAD
jgi:hypothetical protein